MHPRARLDIPLRDLVEKYPYALVFDCVSYFNLLENRVSI